MSILITLLYFLSFSYHLLFGIATVDSCPDHSSLFAISCFSFIVVTNIGMLLFFDCKDATKVIAFIVLQVIHVCFTCVISIFLTETAHVLIFFAYVNEFFIFILTICYIFTR